MLFNPNTMGDFKMKHEKKHKSHSKHEPKGEMDKKYHMGKVEPMAHGKGAQHLKPVKGHHKDVSSK